MTVVCGFVTLCTYVVTCYEHLFVARSWKLPIFRKTPYITGKLCKTLQNIAKHRKTLQNTAKHRKTPQNTAKHRKYCELDNQQHYIDVSTYHTP